MKGTCAAPHAKYRAVSDEAFTAPNISYTAGISTADKSAVVLECTPASIGRNLPCGPLQRDTHTDCHASRIGTPSRKAKM